MARGVTFKRINLALQGGGAHGAFTWGVLDRLLQEDSVEIAGISGTSAGALNGAALKAGLLSGAREGARETLDSLWAKVGAVGDMRLTNWMAGLEPAFVSQALEYSLPYSVADTVSRMVSPYSYGPFYRNPLRSVVEGFDYDKVCAASREPHLFICATRVKSGKIRVFEGDEITTDAILASACLPTLFQAVDIPDPDTGESEPYWDGGYTGNPALFPLYRDNLPADIVVVNINPLERDETPVTPQQIQNRINEISFNSSLLRELRAISFVQRLLDRGQMDEGQMARVYVHMIADDRLMNDLSVATKLLPTPPVLSRLKSAGVAAAEQFLERDFDKVGKESSIDLREMFM